MRGGHIRRLERLEINLLLDHDWRGPRAMTGDELVVGRLVLLRRMALNSDRDQDSRVAAAAGVAEIEASIRQQAVCWSGPEHEVRPAELASMSWGTINYVPALTPDGEHDSLDTPRLMARRAALWARPDIVALLGTTASRRSRGLGAADQSPQERPGPDRGGREG